MTLIELLEQKGTLRVLLYLKEQKVAFLTELKDKIDRLAQTALYSATRKLLDLKLIKEDRGSFNKRVFKLTEIGRKVATKLKEIEEILNED